MYKQTKTRVKENIVTALASPYNDIAAQHQIFKCTHLYKRIIFQNTKEH